MADHDWDSQLLIITISQLSQMRTGPKCLEKTDVLRKANILRRTTKKNLRASKEDAEKKCWDIDRGKDAKKKTPKNTERDTKGELLRKRCWETKVSEKKMLRKKYWEKDDIEWKLLRKRHWERDAGEKILGKC